MSPNDRPDASGIITMVYLGAVGRSGTTLLDRALATSPSFVSLGEVVHVWDRGLLGHEPCGCGSTLDECGFWSEVGKEAFGGWNHCDVQRVLALRRAVDRNRYIPWLIAPNLAPRRFRSQRDELLGVLGSLYSGIAHVARRTAARPVVLVDSSKHPSYYFLVRALPSIDVRLLHVVRDPRGVAHSWTKMVARPETGIGMERLGTAHAIGRWVMHNLAFSVGTLRHPGRRLNYEVFARQPGHLAAVAADLVTDTTVQPPAIDGSTITFQTNHTVSGNPIRFKTGPIEVRPDDIWTVAMPTLSRVAVTVATAPLRWWYR